MNVVMYTTHCPRCLVLAKKLKDKSIPFEEVTDTDIMLEKGFSAVPILEVDGKVMNYQQAFNYIDTL